MSGHVASFLKTSNVMDVCLTRAHETTWVRKKCIVKPLTRISSPPSQGWVGAGGGEMLGKRFAIRA